MTYVGSTVDFMYSYRMREVLMLVELLKFTFPELPDLYLRSKTIYSTESLSLRCTLFLTNSCTILRNKNVVILHYVHLILLFQNQKI